MENHAIHGPLLAVALIGLLAAVSGVQTVPPAKDAASFFVKDTVPAEFPVIISPGILFGKFSKQDGPFLIAGSVVVPSGEKLEFEAGSKVYITNYATITVFGQMIMRGTANEPILVRSADPNPNPWDWDRIYVRSRSRSLFEYCVIRHSNYGIFVENGSVGIDNCVFEKNSLHALVVRNSEVSVSRSVFRNGHVCALLLEEGAQVAADSISIQDNITGMACRDRAEIKMTNGEITRNTNGIALSGSAGIDIVAADVTRNRNGILSLTPVPKAVREMVYDNDLDNKVMIRQDFEMLLKPPEAVKSVVLPKTQTAVQVKSDFKPGFSAQKAPAEQTVSFMGNVTTGFRYYMPTSLIDTLPQTHYPGVPGDFLSGLQPEVQIFTSGRRNAADINLLVDLYGNEWIDQPLHVKKNTLNFGMNYLDQHLVIGDFFESGSETSISGRKFTGMKYSGEFLPMGKGVKRMEFKLAGGETEIPKDSGQHDPSLYNEVVDSGMSMRQQISYIAALSVKPTLNSVVNVQGIIARDQGYQPLFRDIITDPGAPRPIKAQTGCIDGTVKLLDGKLSVNAEIDMGTHDTLDTAADAELAKVAWYNPQVEEAVPAVFGAIPDLKHYAVSLGARGMIAGFDINGSVSQIAPKFFSAGNPYLEADRRLAKLSAEKQFMEIISTSAQYDYERRSVTNVLDISNSTSSPIDKNTISLIGGYAPGEELPEVAADYALSIETSKQVGKGWDFDSPQYDTAEDSSITATYPEISRSYDALDVKHLAGLEIKQRFSNGMDYSVRYRMMRDNDFSLHPDSAEDDLDDEWQHQFTGRFGFKVSKIVQNKVSFRITTDAKKRDDLRGLSYKFGDQLKLTLIPRKFNVKISGDYSNKADNRLDTNGVSRDIIVTNMYSAEMEAKYTITPRFSVNALGRYEKSLDQTEGSSENYTVKIGGLSVTYLF